MCVWLFHIKKRKEKKKAVLFMFFVSHLFAFHCLKKHLKQSCVFTNQLKKEEKRKKKKRPPTKDSKITINILTIFSN